MATTTRMVRYTLKADRVAENERLVRAVFQALQAAAPAGLRYATFKQADGVSFMHLVSQPAGGDTSALTSLPEFQAFVAEIRSRCETPPVTTELEEIGNHGFTAA
ncbi:hypothetical protein M2165_000352 [Variovorax sp. TBS-050B]|uniref:hypothetical protein n=1 Tax=Variovorax sp. TBS-050B TaxID=2940551 RepID=UPI0024745E84|nr:hypothetical protein [Variovorax sp. TBS-050B]MDH6590463.1 hypothetical protein [Variovorax sp. TBS-050B]